jgi:hypothetical protein
MGAGRLAFHGADAGRNSLAIRPSLGGVAKKPLGHGTATDIARADEKNGLHSYDKSSATLRFALEIVNREYSDGLILSSFVIASMQKIDGFGRLARNCVKTSRVIDKISR